MVGRVKMRARKTLEDIIVQDIKFAGAGVNGMGIDCRSKDGRNRISRGTLVPDKGRKISRRKEKEWERGILE